MRKSPTTSLGWLLKRVADELVTSESWVRWQASPGPQQQALDSPADEIFYGGQAGGGKSDLLIGSALLRHHRSILFRREYPQLRDLIERSRQVIGQSGVFHVSEHRWTLPGGRALEFGACQFDKDKYRYQGRAHDLKGFDEITHFSEAQYLFLSGWNRTARRGQRCRVIATGNPPDTEEGQWVIRRWRAWLDPNYPNRAEPGELRWFARIDGQDTEVESGEPFLRDGVEICPRSRTFIPARLSDNPYLADSGYASVIDSLPEPLRSQLKYGDFSVKMQDDLWQVIPSAWVRSAMERWSAECVDLPIDCIGVDVARGGLDSTAIAIRRGSCISSIETYQGEDTDSGSKAAALVMRLQRNPSPVHVDVIGCGASCYDHLKLQGVAAIPLNGASRSVGRDRSGQFGFMNLRAEMYWRLREALDPEGDIRLALPRHESLAADLCASRWQLSPNGIRIESKDDIRKRLGRSPDLADAIALAVFTVQRIWAQDPATLLSLGKADTR